MITQGSRDNARTSALRDSRSLEPDDTAAGTDGIYEQSRRVRKDLEGLASAVFEARASWEATLREKLTDRPYVGLATAAGLGYVLGAGASPALLRVAFGLGSRIALAVFMRKLAVPLTEALAGRAP